MGFTKEEQKQFEKWCEARTLLATYQTDIYRWPGDRGRMDELRSTCNKIRENSTPRLKLLLDEREKQISEGVERENRQKAMLVEAGKYWISE